MFRNLMMAGFLAAGLSVLTGCGGAEVKKEAPKDAPKPAAKTETPKTETPKTETPKTETPKTETAKPAPAPVEKK